MPVPKPRPRLELVPPPLPTRWERFSAWLAGTELGIWWQGRKIWRWKAHGRDGCTYTLFYRLHIIDTPWGNLVLHWIINADPLPLGLHDHPWPFKSIVLWGGYTEKFLPEWCAADEPWAEDYVMYRYRGAGSYDSHPSSYTHALVALKMRKPCLTICWTGKRDRMWGFPAKHIIVKGQPNVES
jgi:hypothetical protein